MKEKFHFAPPDQSAATTPEKTDPPSESAWSVRGGEYQDPDPNVVNYINEKFEDPERNIIATVMKALELAGSVKTIKQIKKMTQPLEVSGLLPLEIKPDEPPQYSPNSMEANKFTDRRDVQLLIELVGDNDVRNSVLLKVIEMTRQRGVFNDEQVKELWGFGRDYRRRNHELPSALKIITVMVGINPPDNSSKTLVSKVPTLTRELAPDIYWMMLREEEETAASAKHAQTMA